MDSVQQAAQRDRQSGQFVATHGHTKQGRKSSTYNSWASMLERCTNPKVPGWKWYGAKGVTIDPRWQGPSGFANFLADMGERPEGMSLDRIDPSGNYEPANCRWATTTQQRWNRRPDSPGVASSNDGPCNVTGCTNKADTKQMCEMHYTRWRRHGDPLINKNHEHYASLDQLVPDDRIWLDGWEIVGSAERTEDDEYLIVCRSGVGFAAPGALLVRRAVCGGTGQRRAET